MPCFWALASTTPMQIDVKLIRAKNTTSWIPPPPPKRDLPPPRRGPPHHGAGGGAPLQCGTGLVHGALQRGVGVVSARHCGIVATRRRRDAICVTLCRAASHASPRPVPRCGNLHSINGLHAQARSLHTLQASHDTGAEPAVRFARQDGRETVARLASVSARVRG